MENPKIHIIERYFRELEKLEFCVELLDRGFKNSEKRMTYENQAKELNKTLAEMEDANPFITQILQIIDKG